MSVKIIPAGMKLWPDEATKLTTEEVIKLYENGFAATFEDPEERDRLHAELQASGMPQGELAATAYGIDGLGKGKLTILFPAVTSTYGYEALTWPGQETGDCVSQAMRDTALGLVCIDALSNTPDEVTGLYEAAPEVSETARKNGVFANEPYYLARGHSGQGMSCDQALRWAMKTGGVVIRQKYAAADLEAYNVRFSIPGNRGVPEWLNEIGAKNKIRNATEISDHEAGRDFLAAGHMLFACSSLGFSDQRDENGHSNQRGSWAHSWDIWGYDDRPEIVQKYGKPQALFGHRWGQWNSGGRRILGTEIDIPHGFFWFDAPLMNRCYIHAVSSVQGWARKQLPDWGSTGVI